MWPDPATRTARLTNAWLRLSLWFTGTVEHERTADARAGADDLWQMSLNTALTSGDGAEGSERGSSGTGSAARFTVLGMLTVGDGTESVALQPSRPAALLAALLLHANSVVSAEFLQRVIWGARPPAQAKSALHSCVLRLRRLFGKYGIAPDAIQAVPGGYRLIADAATLDLVEFRGLLERAYSSRDPENELGLLRAALALWQPPLMANVHSELLHRDEVPRLREEWLRAIERVFELELARGRHREALAEIGAAARQYPLHERFTEQLMEALRRTGRRAEALAEYRRTKRRLAEQLGVDPGPQLQRLELDILRGAPAPPLPAAPSAPAAIPAASEPPAFGALPPGSGSERGDAYRAPEAGVGSVDIPAGPGGAGGMAYGSGASTSTSASVSASGDGTRAGAAYGGGTAAGAGDAPVAGPARNADDAHASRDAHGIREDLAPGGATGLASAPAAPFAHDRTDTDTDTAAASGTAPADADAAFRARPPESAGSASGVGSAAVPPRAAGHGPAPVAESEPQADAGTVSAPEPAAGDTAGPPAAASGHPAGQGGTAEAASAGPAYGAAAPEAPGHHPAGQGTGAEAVSGAPAYGQGVDAAAGESSAPGGEGVLTGERVLDRLVGAGLLQEGPRGHYRMHELLRTFTRAAAEDGVGARARSARRTPLTPPGPAPRQTCTPRRRD